MGKIVLTGTGPRLMFKICPNFTECVVLKALWITILSICAISPVLSQPTEKDFNSLKDKGLVRPDLPEMITIDAGTFDMGCINNTQCGRHMLPVTEVKVETFRISKFETTQALWESIVGKNPSAFKGKTLPIENISRIEIKKFILKLNKLTGQNYRLPTEAEWEYAARGGSNTIYSWGNRVLSTKANFGVNIDTGTKPVGSYPPNQNGLYDMHGNVWEMVEDCWRKDYLPELQGELIKSVRASFKDAFGDCHTFTMRGGAWVFGPFEMRADNRAEISPTQSTSTVGFRLAQNIKAD